MLDKYVGGIIPSFCSTTNNKLKSDHIDLDSCDSGLNFYAHPYKTLFKLYVTSLKL